MRAVIIKNGVVINATNTDTLAHPDGLEMIYSDAEIGCTYKDGVFYPPTIPEKTPEQIYRELESAVDGHVDSVAQAKGYDNRLTATMRAGYVNPWQAEGIAFGQWMDSCYEYCQGVQADILAGTRPIPTIQELIAELSEMVWPE